MEMKPSEIEILEKIFNSYYPNLSSGELNAVSA